MMEAVENVCVIEKANDVGPVPSCVPGEFTVRLGIVMPGWVMDGVREEFAKFGGDAGAATGFLSMMHWIEEEVRGCPGWRRTFGSSTVATC